MRRRHFQRFRRILPKINAVETDQCKCETGRETVRHFPLDCTPWADYRADLISKAAARWRNLSFFLGEQSESQTRDRDRSQALDEEPPGHLI